MSVLLLRIASFFIILSLFSVGCQSSSKWKHYQGGMHLLLHVESKGNTTVDAANTARISEIIGERLKQFGIKNRIIKVQSERQIVIQLPLCKNPDRAVDLISKPCILEFKLVDDEHSLQEALNGNIPPGSEILYQKKYDQKTGKQIKLPYLVKIDAPLTGEYITDAATRFSSFKNESVYVSISFNSRGAELLDQITGKNIGRRLAIVLDNEVYSAPKIQQRISGGEAVIEGAFTIEEARDLAIVLRAGAFPTPVKVSENLPLSREIWLGDDN